MTELAETMLQIAKAQDILTNINNDPKARELYRVYEKARLDEISALAFAKSEGKKEEKLKVAKEMKTDGMDNKKIQQYTGLSIEEIEKI